eukprot:CAMPEP_0201120436 /NCGR_PEP_ID=MMETSP0850-20130426/4493_1 /ASSEMBLY_ACC=CAM_ASM_000622 /TAXON_ID=183588 /ORGANISM="Pseudo-nitzschia fraudulenta, Strain WWA7" /LENGTH=439 /DNA_ID=CAMNT_0047386569 /DNA_START=58 /DNA_END=1377 /DNA_ORIENTATION=-
MKFFKKRDPVAWYTKYQVQFEFFDDTLRRRPRTKTGQHSSIEASNLTFGRVAEYIGIGPEWVATMSSKHQKQNTSSLSYAHPTAYMMKVLAVNMKLLLLFRDIEGNLDTPPSDAIRLNNWHVLMGLMLLTRCSFKLLYAMLRSDQLCVEMEYLPDGFCVEKLEHYFRYNAIANFTNRSNQRFAQKFRGFLEEATDEVKEVVRDNYLTCSSCGAMHHKIFLPLLGNTHNADSNSSSASKRFFLCRECHDTKQETQSTHWAQDRPSSIPSGLSVQKNSSRRRKKKNKKSKQSQSRHGTLATSCAIEKIQEALRTDIENSIVSLKVHTTNHTKQTETKPTDIVSNDDLVDKENKLNGSQMNVKAHATNDTKRTDTKRKNIVSNDDLVDKENKLYGSQRNAKAHTTNNTKRTDIVSNDDLVDYLMQSGSIIALNNYMDELGLD